MLGRASLLAFILVCTDEIFGLRSSLASSLDLLMLSLSISLQGIARDLLCHCRCPNRGNATRLPR